MFLNFEQRNFWYIRKMKKFYILVKIGSFKALHISILNERWKRLASPKEVKNPLKSSPILASKNEGEVSWIQPKFVYLKWWNSSATIADYISQKTNNANNLTSLPPYLVHDSAMFMTSPVALHAIHWLPAGEVCSYTVKWKSFTDHSSHFGFPVIPVVPYISGRSICPVVLLSPAFLQSLLKFLKKFKRRGAPNNFPSISYCKK
jgi:hypothetical protein